MQRRKVRVGAEGVVRFFRYIKKKSNYFHHIILTPFVQISPSQVPAGWADHLTGLLVDAKGTGGGSSCRNNGLITSSVYTESDQCLRDGMFCIQLLCGYTSALYSDTAESQLVVIPSSLYINYWHSDVIELVGYHRRMESLQLEDDQVSFFRTALSTTVGSSPATSVRQTELWRGH